MIYTVWKNNHTGIQPDQKCLKTITGHFIGLKNGLFYDKEDHYASKTYEAVIVDVDEKNQTGMYHLNEGDDDLFENKEENAKSLKSKYIGCKITVEAAHQANGKKIYRCKELTEYFSEDEIQLLSDDSIEWVKYSKLNE